MAICNRIVQSWGELPETVSENQPYLTEYMRLRDALREYERAKTEPQLSLVEHPTGGLDEIRAFLDEQNIDLNHIDEIEREEVDIGF
jgi:glutaredoxin-related protein